jgi:hypothetical protein
MTAAILAFLSGDASVGDELVILTAQFAGGFDAQEELAARNPD